MPEGRQGLRPGICAGEARQEGSGKAEARESRWWKWLLGSAPMSAEGGGAGSAFSGCRPACLPRSHPWGGRALAEAGLWGAEPLGMSPVRRSNILAGLKPQVGLGRAGGGGPQAWGTEGEQAWSRERAWAEVRGPGFKSPLCSLRLWDLRKGASTSLGLGFSSRENGGTFICIQRSLGRNEHGCHMLPVLGPVSSCYIDGHQHKCCLKVSGHNNVPLFKHQIGDAHAVCDTLVRQREEVRVELV